MPRNHHHRMSTGRRPSQARRRLVVDYKRRREVLLLQRAEKCHTSKAAVERVAREIMDNLKFGLRLQRKAVEALQVASEDHLHGLFKQASLLAAHAGRTTVMKIDMELIRKLEKVRNE
jgi:histone H3/H4